MTINEAIDTLDSLQPNTCTREEKLAWLWRLDGFLHAQIWAHYGGVPAEKPYTPDTDPDTVLPVTAPWDEIYVRYLQAQVDLVNGELTRYANSSALYNRLLTAYRDHYNRTHTPLGTGWKYF